MPRLISFRFDDGHIRGAQKAAALLAPDRASFFLVSGRLTGKAPDLAAMIDAGDDFGTLDQWRSMAAQGQDVQPHSVTHANLRRLAPELVAAEVEGSLALIRQIHAGPYVFCHPYNALTALDLAALGLDAAGFQTLNSDKQVQFNRLDGDLDLYRLRSWAVREPHFDDIVSQLDTEVPDESWTILAFHSLDGEGHEPWTSGGFARLVGAVRGLGYQIASVAAVVARLKRR